MTARFDTALSDLMTPEQLAEMLHVTLSTLESWRAKGSGPPFVRLGTSSRSPIRYRRSEVLAWIESTNARGE